MWTISKGCCETGRKMLMIKCESQRDQILKDSHIPHIQPLARPNNKKEGKDEVTFRRYLFA